MPKKIEDFEDFYHNTNLLIEERGKKITEELYKEVYSSEELKECTRYQKELANFEPRDFNKIMKTKAPFQKILKKCPSRKRTPLVAAPRQVKKGRGIKLP